MTNCITHHQACDCREEALRTEVEIQNAQIKGLLAVLTQYAETANWQPWPFDKGYTQCCIDWKPAEKAIKVLPIDFLEKEQKREAVISAARDLIFFISTSELRFWEKPLKEAVDALQTLDK